MISITAAEFVNNFGKFNFNSSNEAIAVMSEGSIAGYYISAAQYEEIKQNKPNSRISYNVASLPDDLFNEIASAKISPEFDKLNHLLD
jgi:hypothetical protein